VDVCDICGTKYEARVSAGEKPYHYTESGLDCAYLVGVEVFRCPKCDLETAAIPDMDGLHKLIAESLFTSRTPLGGREFMFIRKEARLGLREYAERSGVSKEAVKEFESRAPSPMRAPITLLFADGAWSMCAAPADEKVPCRKCGKRTRNCFARLCNSCLKAANASPPRNAPEREAEGAQATPQESFAAS
jgi:DNA-binding transcriptional regulator YiaG